LLQLVLHDDLHAALAALLELLQRPALGGAGSWVADRVPQPRVTLALAVATELIVEDERGAELWPEREGQVDAAGRAFALDLGELEQLGAERVVPVEGRRIDAGRSGAGCRPLCLGPSDERGGAELIRPCERLGRRMQPRPVRRVRRLG